MPIRTIDFILGGVTLLFGALGLINKEFWPAAVSLMAVGLLILYFSDYLSRIARNSIEIKKLKEKLIIYERLNKLELEVFRK